MQDSTGPKARSSAARGITMPVVEQLALVTINPFLSGGEWRARCCGMICRWEGLTRGTMRGTLGSLRYDLALENTASSAARKAASITTMHTRVNGRTG